MDCFAGARTDVSTRAPLTAVIARKSGRSSIPETDDGIEKPQRIGYPAGACRRARRRRDPVVGYFEFKNSNRPKIIAFPAFSNYGAVSFAAAHWVKNVETRLAAA